MGEGKDLKEPLVNCQKIAQCEWGRVAGDPGTILDHQGRDGGSSSAGGLTYGCAKLQKDPEEIGFVGHKK